MGSEALLLMGMMSILKVSRIGKMLGNTFKETVWMGFLIWPVPECSSMWEPNPVLQSQEIWIIIGTRDGTKVI